MVCKVILNGSDGAIKNLCKTVHKQYWHHLGLYNTTLRARQSIWRIYLTNALKFLILIMVTSFEVHLPMHHTVNVHCGTESFDSYEDKVAELHFPESYKSIKFDDLLKFSLGWMQSACVDCHHTEEKRKDIVKAGSV